jgi:hypothetical protein
VKEGAFGAVAGTGSWVLFSGNSNEQDILAFQDR